jgi:hypothetical protein
LSSGKRLMDGLGSARRVERALRLFLVVSLCGSAGPIAATEQEVQADCHVRGLFPPHFVPA